MILKFIKKNKLLGIDKYNCEKMPSLWDSKMHL